MRKLTSLKDRISNFITPERTAPRWTRALPYLTLIAFGVLLFILAGAGWEYTNSSEFCGTACHTMPPEYASYKASPHANVKCVECHIGRGYIATQFTRKAGDMTHVFKYIGAEYEVPIYIKSMRPAEQICEKCHNAQKYSDDSLRQIQHFDAENNNAMTTTFLAFKTGGGTSTQGQGKGIHWHTENTVEYIAVDAPYLEQKIPWVRVTYADTGETAEFVDITADLPADFQPQNAARMKTMDCTTCHNRIAHTFPNPSDALDDAMARGIISPQIPYIKKNAVAVIEREYPTIEDALFAIKGLKDYYAENWSEYYAENQVVVDAAVDNLAVMYKNMVFPTMDITWDTHPDNVGHDESAGCFRCHDGKHLKVNSDTDVISAECNLCHTIPATTTADGTIPPLAVADAFQPESHADSLWIARHRFTFDDTCEGCHTIENPGGADNTGFCANSACHASEFKYAGFNTSSILAMVNRLDDGLPRYPGANLTWDDLISPIMQNRCVVCHNENTTLNLSDYTSVMDSGTVIPGNAAESALVTVQSAGHTNALPADATDWLKAWIDAGAPEK